jgi:hypothetical protein
MKECFLFAFGEYGIQVAVDKIHKHAPCCYQYKPCNSRRAVLAGYAGRKIVQARKERGRYKHGYKYKDDHTGCKIQKGSIMADAPFSASYSNGELFLNIHHFVYISKVECFFDAYAAVYLLQCCTFNFRVVFKE